MTIISLTEYEPTSLPPERLPLEVGERLWRTYGAQIAVDFPSIKSGGQWRLTPQGWVGHIPLTSEYHVVLQPKVALGSLFRMLEYAYRLDLRVLEGLVECQSLREFYERLANILARRVLDRSRKGFHRAYLARCESLPYIRGRLDVTQAVRSPGLINQPCHFQEHTADIEDNQILAWTLRQIARSGLCSERVLPTVRRAYRSLQGLVGVQPFSPETCVNRLYHRLNVDYQPMHALCRFFLEQSGPSHRFGDHQMLPFLINMNRLYELFVAEWLKQNLAADLMLKVQERVTIDQTRNLNFDIDLVLSDAATGDTRCVLDTKYKAPAAPSHDDIFQVVAYAEAKGCREAALIYPRPLPQPVDAVIGEIRVRSLTFALDGDLDENGRAFIEALLDVKNGS